MEAWCVPVDELSRWVRIFVMCPARIGIVEIIICRLRNCPWAKHGPRAGFTLEKRIRRFLPYRMARGAQPPIWMVRLYLKLKWAWPLFGKQFLVVARK